ncbi:MAG: endonuclease III [Methanocalculus sp. MSAO_Arc1]|uniref:endonuclease III n=1 Tax=Methanocalculus TaxID=71151 RepID=UPI000FF1F8AC|nr:MULTISPECIES: endonuclease III [unclassified Methanocalculus]MCP1662492.1 endonuclease-3 [Methanocalculus sp. AMF5]RQD80833.1 MAG: endonuclease III [Methanocalculus sp. MSAO_Arc1]
MDKQTALLVYSRLSGLYPHTSTQFLESANPFQCLVLTILSAQTTDQTVNRIAPLLFEQYPTAEALADADLFELETVIRPTGFYHAKAKHIQGAARTLLEWFSGRVPDTMDELLMLPGVGRKTANIVLDHAFSKNVGIAVDTHVRRLAQRIGFSDSSNPDRIEEDLMAMFPQEIWGELTYCLIRHGREVCSARKPACPSCAIASLCRYGQSE